MNNRKFIFFMSVFFIIFILFSCSEPNSEQGEIGLFDYTGDENYQSPKYIEASSAKNQYHTNEDGSPNGNTRLTSDWYTKTSFYHIWVKSFSDSDGDGCGDLRGIINKLDYIQNSVGCDGIWLSPIFSCNYVSKSSKENMHGYDTIDYYSINEYFGSDEDLKDLITEVHKRKMKIIFDFVPNHTSDAHPWFLDSQQKDSDKRNWYLWNDEKLSWNNGMSSETWHKRNGEYYYGAFNGMMPDLNFRNYEVREEMKNVVRWWLNKGFDGLRIDAVRYLIEEDGNCCDTQSTHTWFQELRKELDSYDSEKFMVCEAWIEGNRTTLDKYFGDDANPEFNMVFDFNAGKPCIYSVRDGVDKTSDSLGYGIYKTYGTFLGNHDEYCGRIGTVLGMQEPLIKQATALSLLRPTVPFIYYGNELGQPEENMSGDIRLRGPLNWNLVTTQSNSDTSILKLNKVILDLKKEYSELFTGVVTKLKTVTSDNKVLAYFIGTDYSSNKFLCVYNFTEKAIESYTFKQNSIDSGKTSSILIGDNQENTLVFTNDTATVKNLAPYAYRLYYIGESKITNVFDDETYTQGDVYQYIPESMYLRGNMNNWDLSNVMKKSIIGDDTVYTIDISGSKANSGTFEFKFDTGFWLNGYNWGLKSLNDDKLSGSVTTGQDQNNNIVVKNINSSKTYTITFNFTKLTFSITEKS